MALALNETALALDEIAFALNEIALALNELALALNEMALAGEYKTNLEAISKSLDVSKKQARPFCPLPRATHGSSSGETTPCRVTSVILHGVVSGHPTRGCIPRLQGLSHVYSRSHSFVPGAIYCLVI